MGLESVEMLRTNYSWINVTEIDKLEEKTKKAETWLNEKIEEQSEKSLLETPVFYSHEVYYKIEPIVELAKKLLARPKPRGWGKKKRVKSDNATNATNETDASASDEELTAKIEVNEDAVDNDDREETTEDDEVESDDNNTDKAEL